MKFDFRKIAAIGTSVLLTGMSFGFAAAAAYPSPFTSGSTAVVYGANAALDLPSANSIGEDLGGSSSSSGATVTGGDSVLLEKSTDKLNLGNNANAVFISSVDSGDLPTLLADGTYMDDLNTEYDYTQKISLSTNLGVEHFEDSDYADNEPTIGIKMSSDEHVLNYTLDFTTHPAYNASTMETTTLNILGREYYVLDVKGMGDSSVDNKTTLLDSASTAILNDGDTVTIDGKTVSINFIGSSSVKLNVDGEVTNSLSAGGTYKLDDGSYIGIKEINANDYAGGTKQVEFSLGAGKLELPNGDNIELNDDTVLEIKSFMTQDSSYKLDKIVLQWTTDDEEFITEDSELVMPGFEAVKFTMADFVQSAAEETTVDYSGSDVIELKTTLASGEVTIPLLQSNSTGHFQTIGKDTDNRLVTSPLNALFFNETAGDKYFVASWNGSSDAESYYIRAEVISEDSVNKVRFTDQANPTDTKNIINGSTVSFGDVDITVNNITRDGSKKWFNVSMSDTTAHSFQQIYTAEGLKIFLPYYPAAITEARIEGMLNYSGNGSMGVGSTSAYDLINDTFVANAPFVRAGHYNGTVIGTAGYGFDSFYLYFDEENKDQTLAAGTQFNITLNENSDDKVQVSTVDVGDSSGTYGHEIGSTDNYQGYVNSDLATKTVYSTGGDQDSVVITYAGDQSYAKLYLTAPSATVSGGSSGEVSDDVVVIKDSEVSSASGKNLIVVGGSCVNSAAASLVGGSYCGDAWTDATGVGSGQFLIQSYGSDEQSLTSEVAVLVAGYEAADTAMAADYLMNRNPDTAAGEGNVYSTSTSEVVTSA